MSNKVFVGSLSWNTTDDTLKAFFEQVGEVLSASVIKDKATGRSKGFGFVEYKDDADAKEALTKLNGQTLDGRTIVVNEARPQAPRN